MSDHPGTPPDKQDEPRPGSVANPFAEENTDGQTVDGERPQLNLSKKRAAVLGTGFGLIMVALLVVCFLLSLALASCGT